MQNSDKPKRSRTEQASRMARRGASQTKNKPRGSSRKGKDRRQSLDSLIGSTALYRRLFENMTEEVHFWKLDRAEDGQIKTWRLVDANPPALKTWGRTLDDIQGKTTDEIFGPGATEHYLPVVNRVMSEGAPHSFEDYFPHLDKHFRFTTIPLGDHFITIGADISGIKKAQAKSEQRVAERTSELTKANAALKLEMSQRERIEQSLRESEEMHSVFFELDAVGMAHISLEGRFLKVNDRYCEITGYSQSELASMAVTELTHPEDLDQDRKELETFLSQGDKPYFAEKRYVRKDGSVRWVKVTARMLYQPDGRPRHSIGFVQDITERKQAEESLRRAKEDLAETNANLERLIGQRTAELKEANGRLEADLAALTRMHVLSGRVVEGGGLDGLLNEAMQAAVGIMGAQKGTLELVEGEELRIVAQEGHGPEFLEFFAAADSRSSVCGEALKRGERVVVPDVETSALFAGTPSLRVLREAGVRAVQSTPMVSRSGVLMGILTTQWSMPHCPGKHDLWRIDLLARQASDMIDRARQEEALREREERLRAFLENSAVIGWLKDEEGRHVFLSENYERRFGVSLADWRGKTDVEVWPREIAEEFRRNDQAVLASDKPTEAIEYTTDKQGRKTWWLNHKFAFCDSAGRRYIGGLGVDITERKRAEEGLRDSEARLAAVLENLCEGIIVGDGEGRSIYWNPSALAMFGYARMEECRRSIPEFADTFEGRPLDADRPLPISDWPMSRVLRGEVLRDWQVRLRRLDQDWEKILAYGGSLVRSASGETLAFLSVTDITQKVRVMDALKESEARYRGLVEVSPNAIFVSRDNRIVFVNGAGLLLFGLSQPEQILGKRPFDLFKPSADSADETPIRQALEAGVLFPPVEGQITRPDGTRRDVEAVICPFRYQGGVSLQILLQDITERRLLDRAVLAAIEQEQQRLGQELHDGLCQLLTAAKFKTSLLEIKLARKTVIQPSEARALEMDLNHAIEQARAMAYGLNPIKLLTQGLVSALDELARSVCSAFQVSCSCRCASPVAISDHNVAHHLYRIAQEAVQNGIKHGKARNIRIELTDLNNKITLAIRDDGVGFLWTSSQKTGMGLQSMKARAELIGASLEIQSKPKVGTLVACHLRPMGNRNEMGDPSLI